MNQPMDHMDRILSTHQHWLSTGTSTDTITSTNTEHEILETTESLKRFTALLQLINQFSHSLGEGPK
jgi:hypothetical protein